MVKYKNFGKRILAVLMTVAVVLTASSVDIEALAAALGGLGDTTGYSIPRNGYIGEIVTNSESTNQQIDKVSFKLVQEANRSYPYTVTLYENPTDSTNPESGVLRKTLSGSIASVTEEGEQTINIDVPSDDPIVLTAGESLGVAIRLNPAIQGEVRYYEQSEGNGFRKDTSSSNWEKRGDIILVTTSDYTDVLDDITSVSMDPSTNVFSVGDADVPLNGSVTPSYKRDITYISNNQTALEIVGNAAHAKASGMAVVTATCGTKTAEETFYILDANVTAGPYPYTGEAVEPTVTVKCGETPLNRGTDYTLTCSNNINPGTASYTITGIGTYVGYSKSGTYTISNGVITQDMVDGGTYVIDTNTDTVTNATVGTLRFGTDFTVQATRTSTSISGITYSVRVQGIGNYTGDYTTSKSYAPGTDKLDINSVLNARLTGGTVDDDTYYYTGNAIQPSNNDPNNPNILFTNKDGTAVDFKFYTLSYSGDPTNASEDEPKKVIILGDETKGYTGTIELEYWILPRPIKDTTITLAKESTTSDYYIHTGSAKTPAVTVTYNSVGRTLNTDYTVEYRDNVDVGTATVVIRGKGNFSGSTTKTFEIIPDFVKDAKVNIEGYQTDYNRGFATTYAIAYTGNEQKPRVRWLKLNDETLDGSQYTVTWSDNVDAGNGTGKVIITGKENTRYAGQTFTATFTITPKQLTNSVIINQLSHPYSGSPITLGAGEYNVYDGATMLEENKHYTISYSNNTNAGNGALITATGKGNYTGAITGTFSIAPLPITDSKISIEGIVDKGYTGAAQTQDNLVVKLNRTTLDASNYTLSYTNNTNVGTATVTITGTGNLTGSTSRNFQINPKSLEGLTYTVGGKPCTGSGPELEATFTGAYTGLEVKPAVVVSEGGSTVSSSDYTLHYYNNINIGDAYVEVAGKNAYQGSSVIIKYQITKRSIANATISFIAPGYEMRTDDKMYPKVKVEDLTASYGYRDLVEGTHYKIESTETSAGSNLTAKIVGIGNYDGEQEITYDAGYDIGVCGQEKLEFPGTSTAITTKDSTGAYTFAYIGEQRPAITISDKNGGDISHSGGCTLSYRNISGNGYDAGSEVEVTATGVGENYYGTMTFRYKVTQKDINDLELSDGNTSTTKTANWIYTYDSLEKAVTPTLTYEMLPTTGKTLVQGTDFRVSKDKVGPDVVEEEEVAITGRGNYTGTIRVNYRIDPCNLNSDNVTVSNIVPQQYTGSEIKPKISAYLKVEGKTEPILISPNSGYIVEYSNNKNPTTESSPAKATLTGEKNFTGSKDVEFQIIQRNLDPEKTTVTVSGEYIYDGAAKEATVSVAYDGIKLKKGVDYEVTYDHNVEVGKGIDSASSTGPVIEIKGIGAYTGYIYKGFTIKGDLTQDRFVVTGWPSPSTLEISKGKITIPNYDITYTSESGSTITIDKSYYELIQPSPLTPGEANFIIKGKDVMIGTKTIPVTLTGKLSEATIENIKDVYDYTGAEVRPEPLVTYNGTPLTKGTDYIVEYSEDTTNVGSATLKIKPAVGSNYSGEKPKSYNIKYNLNKATVTGYAPSYDYTGEQITLPKNNLIVTVGVDKVLELTTHYTVDYGENKDVKDGGTIIITAAGDDTTGSKTVTFDINKVTLNGQNCTATFTPTRYEYTGQAITPEPLVRYTAAGRDLILGLDYTLEYPEDIINASTGAKIVTVKGTGNYEGSVTGSFYIDQGTITDSMVTVNDAYYAGGLAVTPPHTIQYGDLTLVEGRDYDISYGGNRTQIGNNIPITFTGKGNFKGTVNKTFNILKADLSKGVVTLSNTQSEYTGASITPGIVATIDTGSGSTYTLKPGIDYDVTHDDIKNVGDYQIVVTGKGNFEKSLSATYTVKPRSLNGANIHIEYNPDQEYTGHPVEPVVSITDDTREDSPDPVVLTQGQDYTVTYANNVNAAPATATNPPTIIITGKGNYADPETGAVNKAFNIGHPLGGLEIVLDSYQYTYDGQLHQPEAQVKRGDTILTEGVDYEKSYSNDDGSSLDANAGGKLVTITGKGGYYQFTSRQYDIVPKVAKANMIKIVPNLPKDESGNYYSVYTGADIEPSVTIYDEEISSVIPVDPSDYDVAYVRNKDMSTPTNPALIRIVFKNNYAMGAESYTMPFYIKAKTIETGFEAYLPGGSQYAYTGNEVEPEVIVKPTSLDTVEGELIEGVDYTLTYINNVNAGTASVVVTGINNYSGEVVLPYNVVANLNDSTIIASDQFYTGSEVHAPLTITCGGNTLVEGVDYAVTYTSDDNWQTRGTATITSLQPYYAGTATKDYNILFDPTILKVIGYANEYAFTGGPIKPDFKIVTPDGQEIPYNPEDITYYNSSTGFGDCTSIGTVTATIPLNIGDKACELKAVYDIIGRNINLCNIVPLYDNVYTGNKLYPPVIIRNEQGELLTEGVDYTLEYSNNIYPGVGKIVITGKGNYIASVTKYFNIIAPNMLGLTAAPEGDNAVKLSWLRNARITGYEIYSGDCSVKYGSTSDTTFTVTGLKQATDYEFKVRTYITANGRTSYGEFKSVTSHSGMGKPEITVQSLARQRATINWTSAGNVSGYEIYRGSSATGTFSKIAVMPSSAGGYSDSNLVSGGTYYYKVRAYDKVGENQFVYGYFSDPKAVTIR